jgi:hypothetical protein
VKHFAIFDAFIGITATSFGLITSYQEQLEYNLRIASLIAGLLVAVLTTIRIIKRL